MKDHIPTAQHEVHLDPWVKNTRLVRQWEDIKHEILLHKWYESEKAGFDIGWERAAVDWMIRFGNNKNKRHIP
ncbi:MAG: DUF4032 domain-containing protein [Lentisphaerota bacterium]